MSLTSQSSTEYNFQLKDCFLGGQMLFVAFGALVLVPLLTGLNPNVALFTAGLGTIVFQIITRGKVPVFLASSFAFIAPIIYGVQTWGIPGTMCGLAAAGLIYILLSLLVRWQGSTIIKRVLPSVVTGPVIMVIGLILAPVAVHMTMGKTGDGAIVLFDQTKAMIVGLSALGTTILVSILGKDYLKDPGIENTMLGDGIAISLASFLGGPPNTTYSEVTGAVALTKIYNPAIMTWAAITVMLLAFIEKLGSMLQTIPVPVMGGIMLLLFGAIMVVGLNTLNRSKQSYD